MFKKTNKEESQITSEETVDEVNGNVAELPKNLTHLAVGIYKNLNDGQWYTSKIQYNPITGESGNFSSKSTGTGYKDEAEFQFRIWVANELFEGQ